MTLYRIYPLDGCGHFLKRIEARCASDEEARVVAMSALAADAKAEVWTGARLVGQVPTRKLDT